MARLTRRAVLAPILAAALTLGLGGLTATQAAAAGITITPSTLPNGTVGVGYNNTLTAIGGSGSYTYSVSAGSLPPGISLGPSSGTLLGTFSNAGAFSFTVKATDSTNAFGTQPYTVTVAQGSSSVTPGAAPSPSTAGALVTYTALVNGAGNTPTGTVLFTSNPGGALCTATLSGGSGSCSTNSTPSGPAQQVDFITASYSSDANFGASSNTTTETVNNSQPTTTSVAVVPTSSTFGQSVSYNVTVTSGAGTPSGAVTVTTGGTFLCTVNSLSAGTGSCSSTSAPAGSDSIIATYDGFWSGSTGTSFNGSSNAGGSPPTLTVTPAATTTNASALPTSSTFGQNVTYTATVMSGGGTPTGSVTFNAAGGGCTATLSGGSASCTDNHAPVGNPDSVTASYSGSSNFQSSSAGTTLTVSKASTTTAISAVPSSPSFGASVTYSATVSVTAPGGLTPGGSVTFTTGATTLCTIPALSAAAGSCTAANAPVGSDMVTGTYAGTASYNGSSGNTTVTVSQASTAVTPSAIPSPTSLGNTITYKANVTSTGGIPTGSVSFFIFPLGMPTLLCTATLSSGTGSCTSSSAPVGSNQTVTATYSGDTNFAPNAATTNITVTQGVTTTTATVLPTSDDFNQSVTYSASVTSIGGTPTGSVAFTTPGVTGNLCVATLSSGQGSCTASNAPIGSDTITGTYSGDSNFLTSNGTANLDVVNQAPTTTVAGVSASPVQLDQSVTYTGTVTSTPPGTVTGTVTFKIGPLTLCSASLGAGNVASCPATTAPLGSDTVTATYAGNLDFSGSSGAKALTVDMDSTTVTVTPNPLSAPFGTTVTYNVTVNNTVTGGPTPTGSVGVAIGASNICTIPALASGAGSCTGSNAPTGSDTITATYSGDGNNTGSPGTGSLTVTKAPTVTTPGLSATSVAFGTTVTYSATVTATPAGTPTGTVTFAVGATTLCTIPALSGGAGSCTALNAPVGAPDSVKATYSGDANYATSFGTISLTVTTATTSTTPTVSAPSVTFGTSVTYGATVTSTGGTPTGSVAFTDGATQLCTATLSSGAGNCNATNAPLGGDIIKATYSGDGNFASSFQTIALTVTQATTATAPTVSAPSVSFGTLVTYGATVTVTSGGGTPTGTVAFTTPGVTGNLCVATLSSGHGTCTASDAPTGSDTITATYSGDTDFMTSTQTVPLTVVQAAPTVTPFVNLNPVQTGTLVTYSVNVTSTGGTPTGTVTFKVGSTTLCTTMALSSGAGSCTATNAPIGSPDTVTAFYSGDTNFSAQSGTTSITVTKLLSTTVVNVPSSSNFTSSVSYSATVTPTTLGGPTPTGSVTFTTGPTTLCTATLSGGTGSCSIGTAPIGVDTVLGTYNGDTNYATSSQSSVLTVNQDPTTTAVTVLPTSVTFGTMDTYSVTVTNNIGGGPTPTGTVIFTTGSGPVVTLCTTAALSGGMGSCTAKTAPGGADTVTGTFSGDTDTATSSGTALLTVSKAGTTTSPTAGTGTAVFGQSVTYTATVASGGGNPTGTVTFLINSSTICTGTINVGTGIASCVASTAPVGSDTVTANYSGDANFSTSSQITSLNVSKAATSAVVTSSANPVIFDAPLSYTATISVVAPGSGSPGGTVGFTSNGVGIAGCGAVAVSGGVAQCSVTNAPAPATYSIVATFTPGATDAPNFTGSTSTTFSETVNPAASTTSSSVNPSAVVIGGSVTYSATVSSGVTVPTGTVVFKIGSATICTTPALVAGAGNSATGSCTAATAAESPNDAVIGTYSGSTTLSASASAPVTLSVGPNAPPPPAGATASDGAPSPSPTGSATAKIAAGSAVGNGYGALTLSSLANDPQTQSVPLGTGAFYELSLDPASQYGSVVVSICSLGGGHSLDFWNGSTWAPLPDQSFSIATGCITSTFNGTSTPALAGMTSLLVAVSASQGPETGNGYWLASSDGGIFGFGDVGFYGSTGSLQLNKPIVGMAGTPDSGGYWLVASDGGIFTFGDATFYGSTGAIHLNQPIVGMATTPDGGGYWLVASDGGIFAFGDAAFYGSTGAIHLNQPIVGMASTPDGAGYWLVASDGGIFAFGDAAFYGSTGAIHLNQPIVGMATTPDGAGYWMVASDGGIFAFGDAAFYGSTGAIHLNQPIVGMSSSADGKGYWLVASDGGIFNFGDAAFDGSAGGSHLNRPIVTISEG